MQDDFWVKDFPTIFIREVPNLIPVFFVGFYGIWDEDPEAVGTFCGTLFFICFIGKNLEEYSPNPDGWESPTMYEPAIEIEVE